MKKTLLALLFMLMALSIFAQEAGTAVADAPVSAPSAEPAPAAAEPVPVMGLTVDKDKLLLFTGNPATKLGVTVNPPEATDKTLVWTSSNPEVVTVSEAGEITPVKPGMATVSVVARDGGMPFDILVEVKENVPVVALTLDKTTYTLALGVGNLQLRPSVVPANATMQELVWSSDSTLVATVDKNGVVNSRSPGKARIMARTADGKFQAFCLITVTKDYVPVQSVMLDRPMLSIVAGSASRQLVPTILPANATYKDVEWTSSDPSVVAVDRRGFLQVLNAGTVTVTATTRDGKKTATSEVTASLFVNGSKVKLDKEVLDMTLFRDTEGSIDALHVSTETEIKRRVHGDSVTLKATVEPETGAPANVSWKTSDDKVAIVSSEGTVTPIGVGTAIITATAEDGGSAYALVRVTMAAPDAKLSLKTALGGSAGVVFGSDLDSGKTALSNTFDIKLAVSLESSGESSPEANDQIRGEMRIYSKGDLYKIATGSMWKEEAADRSKEDDGQLYIDYARVVFGPYGFLSLTGADTQISYGAAPDRAFSFIQAATDSRYGKLTPKSGYFTTIPNVAESQGTDAVNGLALGLKIPGVLAVTGDFGSVDKWNAEDKVGDNTAAKEKTNWGYRVTLVQDFLKDLTIEAGYSNGITINAKLPNVKMAFGGKAAYRFALIDQLYVKPNFGITMVEVESAKGTSFQPVMVGGLLLGWSDKEDAFDFWGAKYAKDANGSYPGLAAGFRYTSKALADSLKDVIGLNVSLNTGTLLGPAKLLGAFEVKDFNADKLEFGFSGGLSADLRLDRVLISPRVLLTHKEYTKSPSRSYSFFKAGLDVDGLVPFVLVNLNYESNDLVNGYAGVKEQKLGKFEATAKVKF